MTEGSWKQTLLAVPGIGLCLLPKIACPAYWPACAGLLFLGRTRLPDPKCDLSSSDNRGIPAVRCGHARATRSPTA